MLVVFCENLSEIILSFVVGKSKFVFFVGQNLNSRITFILERRQVAVCALHGCCPASPDPQPRTRHQFVRADTGHVGWMHAGQACVLTWAITAANVSLLTTSTDNG